MVLVSRSVEVSLGIKIDPEASPCAFPVNGGAFVVGAFSDAAVNAGSHRHMPLLFLRLLLTFLLNRNFAYDTIIGSLSGFNGYGCDLFKGHFSFHVVRGLHNTSDISRKALDAFGTLLDPKKSKMARPLGLEPRTLCLEGKEDGARALYLQGYYSVFLRKSTPAARCTPCAKAMSWSKNGLKVVPSSSVTGNGSE